MILKIEPNPAQKDIEVLITCPSKNKTVDRIVSLLKSVDTQIECFQNDSTKLVFVFVDARRWTSVCPVFNSTCGKLRCRKRVFDDRCF